MTNFPPAPPSVEAEGICTVEPRTARAPTPADTSAEGTSQGSPIRSSMPPKYSLRSPAPRTKAGLISAVALDAASTSSTSLGLLDLPVSLLTLILSQCAGPRELAATAVACTTLRDAARSRELSHIWKAFYCRRWPAPAASSAPSCWQSHYAAREAAGRSWAAGRSASVDALYGGHVGHVRAVALLPDAGLLASGGADGGVRLWNLATSACIAGGRAHRAAVRAVAASHALVASASSDSTIRIWTASSSGSFALPAPRPASAPPPAAAPSSAPCCGGARVYRLHGHTGPVTCLSLDPSGRLLASGCWDMTVRLWDASAGWQSVSALRTTDWVTGVALRGGRIAAAAGAGLDVFDAATGTRLARAAAAGGAEDGALAPGSGIVAGGSPGCPPPAISAVDGERYGPLLFTTGLDGFLRALDMRLRRKAGASWGGGGEIGALAPGLSQRSGVDPLTCVAFDDHWIAVGSHAGFVSLVDLRQLIGASGASGTGAAPPSSGKAAAAATAAAGKACGAPQGGPARLFSSNPGGGRPSPVHAVDLHGALLAVGAEAGPPRVWDAALAGGAARGHAGPRGSGRARGGGALGVRPAAAC